MAFTSSRHQNIYQDLDGAFLLALSIDDSPKKGPSTGTAYNVPDTFDESDDLMEVDATYEMETKENESSLAGIGENAETSLQMNDELDNQIDSQNKDQFKNQIKNQIDHEDDEIDETDTEINQEDSEGLVGNISNSLILSPTSLGAQMAIRRNHKEAEREDQVDYEYDTSMYPSTKSEVARNMTSFKPKVDAKIFLAENDEMAPEIKQAPIYSNEMNKSWNYQRQFARANGNVEIHHHHYYYGNAPTTTVLAQPAISTAPDKPEYQLDKIKLPQPWEESTPNEKIPYMLMTYLQLLVNVIVFGYGSYILTSMVKLIKQDIQHKLLAHANDIMVDIVSCERQYHENQCSPDTIVPALERQCNYWLKCMNQDPFNGGGKQASISAQTIGMILNSLVEPLGLKFWFLCFLLVVGLFSSNFLFGYFRAKTYYGWNEDT